MTPTLAASALGRLSIRERRVRPVQPRSPPLGLFPLLLAAERRQVEQRVAAAEMVGAPRIGGVGVEDRTLHSQEAAQPRHLRGARPLEQSQLLAVVVDEL